MQVAVQPLWRHSQPDTLVLFRQPPVSKEHCWRLALLWRLTHIASSRVILSIIPSQRSLLEPLMGSQKGMQYVGVLTSASSKPFGLYWVDHRCAP